MQHPDALELSKAIESHDRRIGVFLRFDWNRNGMFDHPFSDLSDLAVSVELDKSLSGGLPPGTPFLEGTSASSLELILGGSRRADEIPASVIFSPYHPDSPFFNQDIRNTPLEFWVWEEAENGRNFVKNFSGWIRQSKTNADSGEVQISCLDAAQMLQDPTWLPAFGPGYGPMGTEAFGAFWSDFSSHWVIDYLLRQNGFSQTPLAHKDAVYSATLHGSTCPEIGYPTYLNHSQFNNNDYHWVGGGADGPMHHDTHFDRVLDPAGQAGQFYSLGNTTRPVYADPGKTIGIGFRFRTIEGQDGAQMFAEQNLNGAPMGIVINSAMYPEQATTSKLTLRAFADGALYLELYNQRNGATYSQFLAYQFDVFKDHKWHYVQGEVTFQTDHVMFRLCVDGQWYEARRNGAFPALFPYSDPAKSWVTAPPWNASENRYPWLEWPLTNQIAGVMPFTDFQVYHGDPWISIYKPTFQPNAVLDAGLNKLAYIPESHETPAWDILREIVETEFGSLYVDESGRVIFKNFDTSRAERDTPDKVLDADKITSVSLQDSTDNLVNVVTGIVQDGYLGTGRVYDANEQTLYFDRSNALNRQITIERDKNYFVIPPTGGNPVVFWPEIRGMVWPTHVGRNIIPKVPDPNAWEDTTHEFFGVGSVWAADGHAHFNGTSYIADEVPSVDVWPFGNKSLYIAVFNLKTAPVQLSNGVINRSRPKGSSQKDYNGGTPHYANGRTMRYNMLIPGVVVYQGDEVPWRLDNPESILRDGYRPYEIARNDWTQILDSMQDLARKLLDDVDQNPVPLIDDIEAPMDQRVQLGDTVTITNAGNIGSDLTAIVTGINRRISSSGATDTYSLKLIYRPATWVLGDPVFSVLGRTTILTENVE